MFLEALMAAGDYEPKNKFEQIQIDIQGKLSILFTLNHILLEAAKDHPPEELAELAMERSIIIIALGQCVSRKRSRFYIGPLVLP